MEIGKRSGVGEERVGIDRSGRGGVERGGSGRGWI